MFSRLQSADLTPARLSRGRRGMALAGAGRSGGAAFASATLQPWFPMPSLLAVLILLNGCSSLPLGEHTAVVYALGSREGFTSPLGRELSPACPALAFPGDDFKTSGRHKLGLVKFSEAAKAAPHEKYLIAGYTAPGLPEDHARALSERRAQAVRQILIEMGIEAARMQTVGLGNDFAPSGPSSDVVVIYHAKPAGAAAGASESAR